MISLTSLCLVLFRFSLSCVSLAVPFRIVRSKLSNPPSLWKKKILDPTLPTYPPTKQSWTAPVEATEPGTTNARRGIGISTLHRTRRRARTDRGRSIGSVWGRRDTRQQKRESESERNSDRQTEREREAKRIINETEKEKEKPMKVKPDSKK